MRYADRLKQLLLIPSTQAALILALLVSISAFSFWPGLSGTFQLDDFQNLAQLSALHDSNALQRMLYFVSAGDSGPAGRPVSLASFLINDYAWPTSAWSFKYTNLMIHLINGILIFYMTLRLLPLLPIPFAEQADKHRLAAGLCAALWTIHPLQASTVLYVIQRMTELSTLFMLLGIIAYLHWRNQIDRQPLATYVKLTLTLGACSLLSILSKENGILLFLYLLLLEHTVLQKRYPVQHKYWKLWHGAILILPNLLAVAYLGFHFDKYAETYQRRDFNLWQRLITETRVLFDYLGNIFFPKLGGNGIYHDDYVISQGIFYPATTFFAIIGIIALLAFAVKYKQKLPLVAFAILWFFASHVLESTFLPLEIYFEHRNYLAIFGFCLFIAVFLLNLPPRLKFASNLAIVAILVMLTGFTRFDAIFWGRPDIAPFIWAKEHPRSIRAAQDAANLALNSNNPMVARKIIGNSLLLHGEDSGLQMQYLLLSCQSGRFHKQDFANISATMRKARFSMAAVQAASFLINNLTAEQCPELDLAWKDRILSAMITNPQFDHPLVLHTLYFLKGQLAVFSRNLDAAMTNLDKSSDYLQQPQIPIDQSRLLISAGLYKDALRYLNKAIDFDRQQKHFLLRNLHKKETDQLSKLIMEKLGQNSDA